MNLQLMCPYEKCPFKCPMCISDGRVRFYNLFESNKGQYIRDLKRTIESGFYDSVVITGDTEPTLNKEWLKTVLQVLSGYSHIVKVELQTKNYNLAPFNLDTLNVLAYSITNVKEYLNAWKYKKIGQDNRLVILLTKDFDFLDADNFNHMGFNQITFKVLQETASQESNEWIRDNAMKDFTSIYNIIDRYNGSDISVRIDANCQDSKGRYEIFRSDGLVYKSWSDTTDKFNHMIRKTSFTPLED